MKNRILGISVLLAVIALSLVFTACPPDTEDRVISFANNTSLPITVYSDGNPPILQLPKVERSTDPATTGTITKSGKDITISKFDYNNDLVNDNPGKYIDFSASIVGKNTKGGLTVGSGSIVFSPFRETGSPAYTWKISVIPHDE